MRLLRYGVGILLKESASNLSLQKLFVADYVSAMKDDKYGVNPHWRSELPSRRKAYKKAYRRHQALLSIASKIDKMTFATIKAWIISMRVKKPQEVCLVC